MKSLSIARVGQASNRAQKLLWAKTWSVDAKLCLRFFLLLRLLGLLLFSLRPEASLAHEAWLLTPEQIAARNAQPKPELFTRFGATNLMMTLAAALFILGCVRLGAPAAREPFPGMQERLASYGEHAAFVLRLCLAITLIMAALGLHPRHGAQVFQAATLGMPDLELRLLGENWDWLALAQALIAVALLLGMWVRAAAAATLGVTALGLGLFGVAMLAYAGALAAAALYLLLVGAGRPSLPAPVLPGTGKVVAWLADQPPERAQFLLRVLTGASFLYAGVYYKVLQPNLALGILVDGGVPTFGLTPEVFLLGMAIVEVLAGTLILAGLLLRSIALFLFAAFFFFSTVLGENALGHVLFYGLLFALTTNGPGRWSGRVAKDRSARIVVLGASPAGIHCERSWIGSWAPAPMSKSPWSTVRLVFQFEPLLAEVVAGSVQPGSVVNPIRRIALRCRFMHGEVAAIDPVARLVRVRPATGGAEDLNYDRLIIAQDLEDDFAAIPGLLDHALPIRTVGHALVLRRRVLECLERAEAANGPRRAAFLTFIVVGGGVRGATIAAALRALLGSALASYGGIQREEPRVLLFTGEEHGIAGLDPALGRRARRALRESGVEILAGETPTTVTAGGIVRRSGERIACGTLVGALAVLPGALAPLAAKCAADRLTTDEFLRLQEADDVLVVGECTGPTLPWRAMRTGRHAAHNAWAATQGRPLERWVERCPVLRVVGLGRRASASVIAGVCFGGLPAWLLARFACLSTLPGLERSLRVVLDWLLNAVFRGDIAVLSPRPTPPSIGADSAIVRRIRVEGRVTDWPGIPLSVEGPS